MRTKSAEAWLIIIRYVIKGYVLNIGHVALILEFDLSSFLKGKL